MKLWHFKEMAQKEFMSPSCQYSLARGRVDAQDRVVTRAKTTVDTSYDVFGLGVVFLESASGLSFSTMDTTGGDYRMPSRLVKFRNATPGSDGWDNVREAIAEAYPDTSNIDDFRVSCVSSVCRLCVHKHAHLRLSACSIVSRLSSL